MLQRGQPAVGDGLGELAVRVVLDIQVLGFGAVIHRRSLERVGLDIEVGSRWMFPVPQDLRVGQQMPWCGAGVLHIVNQVDRIRAACEHEGLGYGQSLTISPGQRYAHFLGACRQRERFLGRDPNRKMRGCRFAGGARQTGLQQVQRSRRFAAQEPDRNVRRILAQWVAQEIGLIKLAALQIDGDVEHVGGHMQRWRGARVRRRGNAGRRPGSGLRHRRRSGGRGCGRRRRQRVPRRRPRCSRPAAGSRRDCRPGRRWTAQSWRVRRPADSHASRFGSRRKGSRRGRPTALCGG